MKLYKIIGMVLIMAAATAGCKKSFLDDPKPSDQVAEEQVFASEAGVRSYFNGIYRRMRMQWSNDNVASSTDAWGISSMYLARLVKGDDIVLSDGWYISDYREDNRDASFRRARFTWGYLYEFVNHANVLIDGVAKSGLAPAAKDLYTAEARGLRAWAYFELIREFQFSYAANPNAPGVPIYTSPTTTTTAGNPRGTVSDVYKLITDDLQYAVTKLTTDRINSSDININVAHGLLARVYLEMGNWNGALIEATAALQGHSLDASDYSVSINNTDNAETIWAFGQANDQTIYYGTPSAFWDQTGAGYDNFYINSNFVSKFTETDVRNKFFQIRQTGAYMWGTYKFGPEMNFAEAIIMMRAAEMVLIQAEAKAMLSQADAGDVLYALQLNRDENAIKSGNTAQALIDEILLERRKELYGENGQDFTDLKRRVLPLIRTGNHANADKITMQPTDKRFVLQIPQSEFDTNKSFKASDQNP
jgi:hypothetical protein